MIVEAGEHVANRVIQRAAVGDALVVLRLHVAAQRWVGAAAVGHVLGGQLGFDAGLAEDKDLVLGRRGLEDAGDVDCGAVGGAKDLVLGVGLDGWLPWFHI